MQWPDIVALIGAATALLVAVLPHVLKLLQGKAEKDRLDKEQIDKERAEFYHLMVARVADLVSQLNACQKDIADCKADRAALRQRIEDLEGKRP